MNSQPEVPARKLHNSQTVNSAALATLAGLLVILGLALEDRSPGVFYWVLAGAAGVMLAGSVFVSGLAVSGRQSGFSLFNLQALLCILGFLAVAASVTQLGPTQSSAFEASALATGEKVGGLQVEARELRERVRQLQQQAASAEARLAAVERSIDSLRKPIARRGAR